MALITLRRQAADYHRPFRIPWAIPFAAFAFILVGFIVYWSGWSTNWKTLLIALVGLIYFLLRRALRGAEEPAYFVAASWLIVYYAMLAVVSWLGNFGGGLGIIPEGVDMAIIAVLSLLIFALALRLQLPRDVVRKLIAETDARRIDS